MTNVVPIGTTKHRRYDKRTKAAAVVEAERTNMEAASETLGIPPKTIAYWMEDPRFAELRAKTREELASGSIVLAHLAQAALTKRIESGEVEPRDLAVIYGIAIDKGQLLAGQATSRTETRTGLLETLSDHETAQLADAIDEWLKAGDVTGA